MGKHKKQLKKIERRIKELEQKQTVKSFYFGNINFPDYVKITEKEISRLKSSPK